MAGIVKLAFLGDIMLGRGISDELRQGRSPEWFWGDVLALVRSADGLFANLESPITTATQRWTDTWKFFHFRSDPDTIRILQAGKVRFVCLANNHILDYGETGLVDTLAALDRAGIVHAGAGRNRHDASIGKLVPVGDLKIGVLAATDSLQEYAAAADRPGTNNIEFHGEGAGLDWVDRGVRHLREAGAALVVLSLHWGPNMRLRPSAAFRRFAHGAIERGIDLIHGHSAHVVQAIERHGRGVILYDTGNFIDDYWKFPFRRTVSSFVFMLEVVNGKPVAIRLTPVRIHPWPLSLAQGETRRSIMENMVALSAAMGTRLVEKETELMLALD